MSDSRRQEEMPDLVHSALPHPGKVEALAGFGFTVSEIARMLQVDVEALRAAFPHELDSGGLKANARVAENLYRKATGDGRESVTAAIFWLKSRARWKEISVHEHSGSGMPIVIQLSRDDERLL
jgi:hypothetical protein